MADYLVTLPSGAYAVQDGNTKMVVTAGNAADAKAIAQAFSDSDGAPWESATVTQIVETAEFAGLEIVTTIVADANNGFTDDVTVSYVVPEGASADTVDEIGALLIAALNAHADLSGVTYTSGTDTVTFPLGLNCGLSAITCKVYKTMVGGRFEVTSLAPTVSAVGSGANEARTVVITPLDSGVHPVVWLHGR